MFRHGAVKHVIFETTTLAILNKWHVRIQRGGRESGPSTPLKNNKNIGFLSNIGLDPL